MKKVVKIILIVLLISLVYLFYTNYSRLNIVTGFASKSVASGIYLANRTQKSVELGDNDLNLVRDAFNEVDTIQKSVTVTIFVLKSRKAIYREGLGAVLINDDYSAIYI